MLRCHVLLLSGDTSFKATESGPPASRAAYARGRATVSLRLDGGERTPVYFRVTR